MVDFDVVVVGAGVVGLACAARLARAGHSVLVLERNASPGQETSARNSGVIHAGIYYPEGSLKALTCVRGRELLYERCKLRSIGHRKIGKLIVASTEAELATLAEIQGKAGRNGVDLALLDGATTHAMEPELAVVGALWSPETGIVDAHELIYSYKAEASEHDAVFVANTAVEGMERAAGTWRVTTTGPGSETAHITADWVINSAGLHADRVAALAGVDIEKHDLDLHWCKGDYFVIHKRHARRVTHLVYPVPVKAGLGVHLTFDLGGSLISGPDTEYIDELRYDVAPEKGRAFSEAVSRYLPGVVPEDLTPGYAGIRPKLQGPGETFRDFVIEEASPHGLPRLVNLLGIESPGLTASEAIAERVLGLLTS